MNKILVPKNLKEFIFGDENKDYSSNLNKLICSFKNNKRVLVYGEVQSGKTGNLISYVEHITSFKPYLIIYLTGLKNNLLNQNHERFYDHFDELNTKLGFEKYLISRKEQAKDYTTTIMSNHFKQNGSYITNELKRPQNLEEIFQIVRTLDVDVLLIDDEGDEASLADKTMEKIEKITSLPNVSFLSITATPFSNLYFNEMFYDDYIQLEPWDGYCGIKEFKNNFVFIEHENKDSIEKTIINPLISWANTIKSYDIKDSQILFNFSLYKNNHKEIRMKIKRFLSSQIIELKKQEIITKEIFEILNNIDDNDIIISNSDVDKDKSILNDKQLNTGLKIIIGGGNLSRGITYKTLLTEVMINSPEIPTPGVLLQRARWFGYREDELDKIRIYTTKDVYESFNELDELNDWTKKYTLGSGYKKTFQDKKYKRLKI